MKNNSLRAYIFNLTLLLLTLTGTAFAQKTVVTGTVKDANTKETLPFVSVFFEGTTIGTQTDADGNYEISTSAAYAKLKFNYVGYTIQVKDIIPGSSQKIDVQLKADSKFLDEVQVVGAKRTRYRNKDNPAVELIRNVIERKNQNRADSYPTLTYKKYERMIFSMSNVSEKFKSKKIFRNYQFLFQEQDSTEIGGKNILPVYIEEKLSDNYYQKDPEQRKSIITGEKQVNFDKKYFDNQGMKAYFSRMYQDIDLYDNNISVISNQFLSPIADAAPTFYKFFITDTLKDRTPNVVELSFTPRNTTDMLFEGKLYVALDGNYGVTGADLTVNKNINLNFVRALKVNLDYVKNSQNKFDLTRSKLVADFGINKNKGIGFTRSAHHLSGLQ